MLYKLIVLAGVVSGLANAEVPTAPPADFKASKVFKTKITCHVDEQFVWNFPDREPKFESRNGKYLENIRTTWTDGVVSYHSSEIVTYNTETGSAERFGKAFRKTKISRSGDLETEENTLVVYSHFVELNARHADGQIHQERKSEEKTVSKIEGNKKILLKHYKNGIQSPVANAVTTTTQISPKKRIEEVIAGPYTEDMQRGLKFTQIYVKNTCEFEEL